MVICISLSILTVTGQWILISVFVLINNSCYTEDRGVVNGIGQSFASFARFLGPYSGGAMFAWSLNNGNLPWPLNYNFVFIVIGIISVFNAAISNTLPNSIQKSKKQVVSKRNDETETEEFINSQQSTVSKYAIVKTNDYDDYDDYDNMTDSIDRNPKNMV